jgi:hypothetical protein
MAAQYVGASKPFANRLVLRRDVTAEMIGQYRARLTH